METNILSIYGLNKSIEDKRLMDNLIKEKNYNALRNIMGCSVEMEMEAGWFIEFEKYGFEVLTSKERKGLESTLYKRKVLITYQTLRQIYINKEYNIHPNWIVFYDSIEKLEVHKELITSANKKWFNYHLNASFILRSP